MFIINWILSLFAPSSLEVECPDCSAMVEMMNNGQHVLDGGIPVCECTVEGCLFKQELDENTEVD